MIAFQVQGVPNAFLGRTRSRSWLDGVARSEGRSIAELNYVLLSDKELLRYNQRYLGHDEYTDIITFDTRSSKNGRTISGDILISYDRVKENAHAYKTSAQHELRRVMVHGLLHLCGYGDTSDRQKRAMRALEDKHLKRFR